MSTDDLLHYLPIIVRASGISIKERAFIASLIHRQKRGPLRLSQKQELWLRSIVESFKARTLRDSHE